MIKKYTYKFDMIFPVGIPQAKLGSQGHLLLLDKINVKKN